MTKLLSLFTLLFVLNAQAQTTCQVYEYQGIVRILDKKMVLVINETTMSEMKFKLPIEGEVKLAPFVDLTVKGKLIFKDKKISKILSADYGKAQPLDHKLHSYLRPLNSEACHD